MDKTRPPTHRSPDRLLNLGQELSVRYFRRLFLLSGLSPNQISWLNFCINNLAAVICYAIGTYTATLVGLLFCVASAISDHMDGVVARETNTHSRLGKWLDPSLDNLWQSLFVCSVFYGTYRNPSYIPQALLLPVGLAAIFALSMANTMGFEFETAYRFDPYTGSRVFQDEIDRCGRLPLVDKILINAVFPGSPIFIFFFTIRYLTIIGTIFHLLDIMLLILAVSKTVQSSLMFFVLYRTKSDDDASRRIGIRILKTIRTHGDSAGGGNPPLLP